MRTDPIEDIEVIRDIADYLGERNKRDELLLWLLVYTGLRVDDALDLRVRDVRGSDGKVRNFLEVTEKKTRTNRRIELGNKLIRKIREYVEGKPSYEFLFLSKKISRRYQETRDLKGPTPISTQRAWEILSQAGKLFGVRLSPHALRKTYARELYEISGKDITVPMRALKHTSPVQTERYIGLSESSINGYTRRLNF